MNALRTAAISAMVTRALAAACGITEFRLFDIEPTATRHCITKLEGRNLSLTDCTSIEEAMKDAEVVATRTADKSYQTILTDNHVGAGLRDKVAQGASSEMLDLIADPDDPRDLFGMTRHFAFRAEQAA